MARKTLVALVASSGLFLAGSAASARPSGGIWSDHGPSKKSSTKAPKSDAKPEKSTGASEPAPGDPAGAANADAAVDTNATAGENSQGLENANVQAVARANENSALADGAVAGNALPGLTTGLNVKSSAGASLGTVSQVVMGSDGTIRLVIVNGENGTTYRLLPNQLSIAGGVVTTTETNLGG